MSNVVHFPVAPNYEAITQGLSDEELFALAEALSMVSRSTPENDRLRTAIVRELSIREAYLRGAARRHPSKGN